MLRADRPVTPAEIARQGIRWMADEGAVEGLRDLALALVDDLEQARKRVDDLERQQGSEKNCA